MHSYELRVINPDDKYPTIYASSHLSDITAVRRAVSLADADELIEVVRRQTNVDARALKLREGVAHP